ncbi:MAG TPA: O-antigen ligase family protein [Opitutaceae bacterium]|nr:O-antigen ligase family protein [Opitutaceae bacterium]
MNAAHAIGLDAPHAEREPGPISHSAAVASVAVLLGAPLAYACTRPLPLHALGVALHAVLALWIVALFLERRRPRIDRALLIVVGAVVVYFWIRGVFAIFNGDAIDSFTRSHWARIASRWPESIILRTPAAITLLCSGLACSFLVVSDLSRNAKLRRTFQGAMIGGGVLVVVLGLVQNATRARGVYWQPPHLHMPSPFFGSFYHFTSAGAFLNLTWPPALCLSLYWASQYKRIAGAGTRGVAFGLCALLILVGHTAHVSRLPQVLAAVTLLVVLAVIRPIRFASFSPRRILAVAVAICVLVPAVGWTLKRSGRLQQIQARWKMLDLSASNRPPAPMPAKADWPRLVRDDLAIPYPHSEYRLKDRGAAYAFALRCIALRPLFGFGPGGWITAVSQHGTDPTIGTFYLYLQFTHEDYLQTAIEWGLVGAGLILAVGVLSIIPLCRVLPSKVFRSGRWSENSVACFGALAALIAVLLQALIDFPLQIPANALYATTLLALLSSYRPLESRSF